MGYRIKAGFPINIQVGKRLKELRNKKGSSQQEVAEYLGVCRSTYTKYETGASTLSYSNILILARLYIVRASYVGQNYWVIIDMSNELV